MGFSSRSQSARLRSQKSHRSTSRPTTSRPTTSQARTKSTITPRPSTARASNKSFHDNIMFKTFMHVNQINPKYNIDLYKCPKSGQMRKSSIKNSFTRWKTRSYLEQMHKWTKRYPSPADHHTNLKWIKRQCLVNGKGSDRIMIIGKLFVFFKVPIVAYR